MTSNEVNQELDAAVADIKEYSRFASTACLESAQRRLTKVLDYCRGTPE